MNSPELSEYEKGRAQRIMRNNARLVKLGLISKTQQDEGNQAAWGQKPTKSTVVNHESSSRKIRTTTPKEPSRKSLRFSEGTVFKERSNLLETAGRRTNLKNHHDNETYNHCLQRIQTMSQKALANRVRAIERARGKRCIEKMSMFRELLEENGMEELAQMAQGALTRLKRT